MKTPCIILATALAATLRAAVPVAWTNSPGMPPYPIKPVPHGVPVDFRVTLKGYTSPLIAPGADLHLWYQTNGMGKLWWPAPAALEGDVIAASFGPAQDVGADRVSLFFGAPSNVFASAVLRLTHSPGFAPASLPLPVPVLDFAAVDLVNVAALTNGWSFGDPGGPYLSTTGGVVSGTVKVEGSAGMSGVNGHAELGRDGVSIGRAGFPFSSTVRVKWPSAGNGTFARLEDIPVISASDATFSNAVLAVGIGIDTNTVAEINALVESEGGIPIGGATSVGGLLLALAAAVAALKKRLALKADAADLRYKIVTPGEWTLHSESYDVSTLDLPTWDTSLGYWWIENESLTAQGPNASDPNALSLEFMEGVVTATRASLPGHLLDRASNRVSPADASALTLTLPDAVPGYMRDLIVRLDLTALATAPEVTFAAPTGETVRLEAEGGAMPELEAGKANLVSLTETAPGVIDVAHKTMQEVA